MTRSTLSFLLFAPLLAIGCTSAGTASGQGVVPASTAAVSVAQPGSLQPSAALQRRAAELISLINGKTTPEALFAPQVLTQGRGARLAQLAAQVRARRGEALGVNRIELTDAANPNVGNVFVDFADSQFAVKIRVSSQAPHLIDALAID